MASTYSTNLRIELMADGENSTTWGSKTNTNWDLIEQAVSGVASVAMTDADYTLTTSNAAVDEARNAVVTMTGTLTQARNVIVPSVDKQYVFKNSTTGGFSIVVKTAAGTGITVLNGETEVLYCDATNVLRSATTPTGSGAPVRAASPTFTGTVSGTVAAFSGSINSGVAEDVVVKNFYGSSELSAAGISEWGSYYNTVTAESASALKATSRFVNTVASDRGVGKNNQTSAFLMRVEGAYDIAQVQTVVGSVSAAAGFTSGKTLASGTCFQAGMTNDGAGTFGTIIGYACGDYTDSLAAPVVATNNVVGFYSAVSSGTGRHNFYSAGTATNYFTGTIASLGSYNTTTATAANAYIDSAGLIQRSTSSLRYKIGVENLQSQYADAVVFGARPVWYRSKCENDNAGWGWYGLIAEELAEIDPRLVQWGRPDKEVTVITPEGNEIQTKIEDIDAPLQAEGVMYDRLTVMLIDVVQRQQQAITELEQRITALGG